MSCDPSESDLFVQDCEIEPDQESFLDQMTPDAAKLSYGLFSILNMALVAGLNYEKKQQYDPYYYAYNCDDDYYYGYDDDNYY